MHHAYDLKDFMREVGRVLKPGGMFIGAREHVVSRHEDIPEFQAAHPLHALYGGEYAYRVDEYKAAITGAGLRLTACLNPLSSEVNIAPSTRDEIKRQLARRLGIPVLAKLIPNIVLTVRGALLGMPGRLYTFVAAKPE